MLLWTKLIYCSSPWIIPTNGVILIQRRLKIHTNTGWWSMPWHVYWRFWIWGLLKTTLVLPTSRLEMSKDLCLPTVIRQGNLGASAEILQPNPANSEGLWVLEIEFSVFHQAIITYELLGLVIERSSNIVSLFKELENIRIDAWFLSRKDGVKLKI
jgi:hypothetical protein